jgi:5-formyltetrahydrofolate cyclo-ligase
MAWLYPKDIIRRDILTRRSTQKGDVKQPKDEAIKKRLMELPEYKSAKTILFYVSVRGEVRTYDMISESLTKGKKILVPLADVKNKKLLLSELDNLNDLSPGSFGIPEPKHLHQMDIKSVDLVIVPGIAFDKYGNRVGYGTGFYDRFLKKISKGVPVIALGYDFQLVHEIPSNKMDVKVHKIVTEKGVVNCAKFQKAKKK